MGIDDQALQAKLVEHARQVFGQPDLVYESGRLFHDILGFDSIRAVQYILAMEEATGVTMKDEEIDNMHTMGDMLAVLRSKLV